MVELSESEIIRLALSCIRNTGGPSSRNVICESAPSSSPLRSNSGASFTSTTFTSAKASLSNMPSLTENLTTLSPDEGDVALLKYCNDRREDANCSRFAGPVRTMLVGDTETEETGGVASTSRNSLPASMGFNISITALSSWEESGSVSSKAADERLTGSLPSV